MNVTGQMRQAVYEADCAEHGHLLSFTDTMYSSTNAGQADTVGAQDPDRHAHITCRRCHHVWLVMEHGAPTYEDAVAELRSSLPDGHRWARPRPRPADHHSHRLYHGHGHPGPS